MNKWTVISLIMLGILSLVGLTAAMLYNWMTLGTYFGIIAFVFFIAGCILFMLWVSKKLKERGQVSTEQKNTEKTQTELIQLAVLMMKERRAEKLIVNKDVRYYNKGEIIRIDGEGRIGGNKWSILMMVKNPSKIITLKDPKEEKVLESANGLVNPLLPKSERVQEETTPWGSKVVTKEPVHLPQESMLDDEDDELFPG